MTPPMREEAVSVLLSRPIWHEALVAALEKGEMPIAPGLDSATDAAGGAAGREAGGASEGGAGQRGPGAAEGGD